MVGREHDRVPLTVEVRYRTASAFLFAYSVNLSKGGVFLETDKLAPIGTALTLELHVPGAGSFEIRAHVSWLRERPDPESDAPVGMGVEFDDIDEALGAIIDELVRQFRGLTVLVFSAESRERQALGRTVRSIVSTADVVEAAGASTVEALLGDEIDLVVIDAGAPDGEGWLVLRAARTHTTPIPAVVVVSTDEDRARARDLDATEITSAPPSYAALQRSILAALGRPSTVT